MRSIKTPNLLFLIPSLVLTAIISYGFLRLLQFNETLTNVVILSAIALGSLSLVTDTIKSLIKGKLSLDYIAIMAIVTGLVTEQYIVAAVIVLMLSGGNALEDYATKKARNSLTNLSSRLPGSVIMWVNGTPGEQRKVEEIKIGDEIIVRKGEVVAMDGELVSNQATIDDSSITGESEPKSLYNGDALRSGTVNVGELLVIRVTKESKNSSYNKILDLVKQAESEKSPMARLADRYNYVFTILTIIIAGIAYVISDHSLERVLAVLVIATPCPLILATPVALIGGVNSAARANIIVKRVAALEVLARVDTLVLDKTGTITLGEPTLTEIKIVKGKITPENALKIASSIERSSLHPFAKAIVKVADEVGVGLVTVKDIQEIVGKGISGSVGSTVYSLIGSSEEMGIDLLMDGNPVARFFFKDTPKEGSKNTFNRLQENGYKLHIFTGDKEEKAIGIIKKLELKEVSLVSECTPEDKLNGINQLKSEGRIIAMVGDGINDAPALAISDVGMVFSNSEQTASSEAADIVFLRSDLAAVTTSIAISKRTIKIALQSITVGIVLSLLGMILASVGLIPPIMGAAIQEVIDVFVILNALRASRRTNI